MFVKIVVLFAFTAVYCFGSDLVSKMSLEEKVGQLLMAHFHGEVANEDAEMLIKDTKVGGIIYYNWSNGLRSPDQVRSLSSSLQKLTNDTPCKIPLLIAADQEGGVVARLQEGFTQFPGNKALGMTSMPTLARESAFITGQEMISVGINMNLAPVIDVNSNPENPIIGIRSFSDNPQIVIAFGEEALKGYKEAGVLATLKHFPGHGDVSIDSHEDMPVVNKTKEELEKCELMPFAKLSPMADAIMTAHILVPALDPDNCSTLSAKTLTYLRETIGFEGLIVTDSLVMGGVLKKCLSVDEATLLAFDAGCDLLILGGKLLSSEHNEELKPSDVQRVAKSMVKAVQNGRISEARVDASVRRILALKKGIQPFTQKKEKTKLNSPTSQALALKIAALSLKSSVKEAQKIGLLREKHLLVVAPQLLQSNIEKTSLLNLGKSTNSFFFQGLNPSLTESNVIKDKAKGADLLLVCSYNAWKNPSVIDLIQSLQKTGKPLILLTMRDPTDADLFSDANLNLRSFSPSIPSIQAICDLLLEKY